MSNMKLGKRQHITVVDGEKGDPTRGTDGDIYKKHQYFHYRVKHLEGSTRPKGWYHDHASYIMTVEVRWLWTESLGYLAPEVTFKPYEDGLKLARKVGQALVTIRNNNETPDGLIEALKADVVEYVSDNKDGCWSDYRPIRVWEENAMMTLARAAS